VAWSSALFRFLFNFVRFTAKRSDNAVLPRGTLTMSTSYSSTEPQWWISVNGNRQGPYSEAEVRRRLQSHPALYDAYACLVDDHVWHRIKDLPVFAEPVTGSAGSWHKASELERRFRCPNPQLPVMANWIGAYMILLWPVLWGALILQGLASGGGSDVREDWSGYFVADSLTILVGLARLAVTIYMIIGGVRLQSLRPSGVATAKIALWCSLVLTAVSVGAGALIGIAAAADDALVPCGPISSVELLPSLVSLAALGFEIVALIWLYRNERAVPGR